MAKSKSKKKPAAKAGIAPPEVVLKAAEEAPRVFSIGAYYQPIRTMRVKGRSWRETAGWLRQFNIRISHVHLRRLFVEENARLADLTKEELEGKGAPDEVIEEILEKGDPARRITARDPEEARVVRENVRRLREIGWAEEDIQKLLVEDPGTKPIEIKTTKLV